MKKQRVMATLILVAIVILTAVAIMPTKQSESVNIIIPEVVENITATIVINKVDNAEAVNIQVKPNFSRLESFEGWIIENTEIKASPSDNSNTVAVSSSTEEFVIYKVNDDWCAIDCNEITGFVRNESIIKEEETNFILHNTPKDSIKSYLPYNLIGSGNQYKLQQIAYTDANGLRVVNGRYCIAVGSAFTTKIGTWIDLILENGQIIPCVLADCKADIHTDYTNMVAGDGSIAEFLVDMKVLSNQVRTSGDVSNVCEEWKSNITKVMVYEKVENY